MSRAALGAMILLLAAEPAWAHGLNASCRPRGDRIEVAAYFTDDTPAQEAKVQVIDQDGNIFAEGVTDEYGRWQFARPRTGTYQVKVDAGAGHEKTLRLTDDFLSDGPTREEFTQGQWLKLVIGVATILALGFGFYFARRRARPCETYDDVRDGAAGS